MAKHDNALMANLIELPAPCLKGQRSLEEALTARRSIRAFSSAPLSLPTLSQLLWATQGITGRGAVRTAPSAGARFPIELYLVVAEGAFHYQPQGHQLIRVSSHDLRLALGSDPFGSQPFIAQAPAVFVFAVVEARTKARYGSRGDRYIAMDVGHAAENLCLQATALGLGSCCIGAFDDDYMTHILAIPSDQSVIYMVPVGAPVKAES